MTFSYHICFEHRHHPKGSLVRVKDWMDENFEPHDEEFTGLPAWVIQHEYDHLEGVVFTDRLSPLRRNLIKSKLMSLTKGRYKCSYKTK